MSCSGSSKEQEAMINSLNSRIQACTSNAKNYTWLAQCENQATMDYFVAIDYPYLDLIQLYNSYKIVVAEKLDRGEITLSEANLELAKIKYQVTSEINNRMYQQAEAARWKAELWRHAFEQIGQTKVYIH